MPVQDRDNGYRKVLENAAKGDGLHIAVGIHAESSGDVLAKAESHEFGLGNPQRPFVSGWADEYREEALREMKEALSQALARGEDPFPRLERLALKYQGMIQARMAAGIPPPSLVDGRTIHLIETGELRSNVIGKVVR
jgi:hypothetical protein